MTLGRQDLGFGSILAHCAPPVTAFSGRPGRHPRGYRCGFRMQLQPQARTAVLPVCFIVPELFIYLTLFRVRGACIIRVSSVQASILVVSPLPRGAMSLTEVADAHMRSPLSTLHFRTIGSALRLWSFVDYFTIYVELYIYDIYTRRSQYHSVGKQERQPITSGTVRCAS
jgi:hypothetical protein